ncbi:MAG TPA: suppressor of fused domain protein [Kineosporiaceae bacterium]|nr:suppressor of fused domain protein [Kineosporiaceae bacterium]
MSAGPMVSASVTFLGTEPLEVLRFGPDAAGVVRYASVGIARRAMHPPTAAVADPLRGPRSELLLSLRPGRDDVLRALAVVAASPDVEGVVLTAGATLDLQTPLWAGARVSAVLLGEPGGLVPDLDLDLGLETGSDGVQPVRFHPLLPMTAAEAALSRAKGAGLVQQLWLDAGTDLRDPDRRGVV